MLENEKNIMGHRVRIFVLFDHSNRYEANLEFVGKGGPTIFFQPQIPSFCLVTGTTSPSLQGSVSSLSSCCFAVQPTSKKNVEYYHKSEGYSEQFFNKNVHGDKTFATKLFVCTFTSLYYFFLKH